MADLDTKIKSIIKDTIKSRSIKKESLSIDPSLYEIDDSLEEGFSQPGVEYHSSSQQRVSFQSSKRFRQPETIDLRSPNQQRRKKKQDSRPPYINPQGLFLFLQFISSN